MWSKSEYNKYIHKFLENVTKNTKINLEIYWWIAVPQQCNHHTNTTCSHYWITNTIVIPESDKWLVSDITWKSMCQHKDILFYF